MYAEHRNNQVYHHRINKGGLDDILCNQRLKASDAKVVAGGGFGVRAHSGPLPGSTGASWNPESDQKTTVIEFKASRSPDDVHPRNGQVRWRMEDGEEYLHVEVTKVQRGGLTINAPPRSEEALNAAFEEMRKASTSHAALEIHQPDTERSASASSDQGRDSGQSWSQDSGTPIRKQQEHEQKPSDVPGNQRGAAEARLRAELDKPESTRRAEFQSDRHAARSANGVNFLKSQGYSEREIRDHRMVEKEAVARSYYRTWEDRNGKRYPDDRVNDHLRGIDFRKEVELRTSTVGEPVGQYQLGGTKPGERLQGNYYAPMGIAKDQLGIVGDRASGPNDPGGRKLDVYLCNREVPVLQSTARDVELNPDPNKPDGELRYGGGTQLAVRPQDRDAFERLFDQARVARREPDGPSGVGSDPTASHSSATGPQPDARAESKRDEATKEAGEAKRSTKLKEEKQSHAEHNRPHERTQRERQGRTGQEFESQSGLNASSKPAWTTQSKMRTNNFSPATREDAWDRQGGKCASCADDLRYNKWNGHHVIPAQASKEPDAFLKSSDNCVALCESCHTEFAHDGKHYATRTESPESFPHSHGSDQAAHSAWVSKIEGEWERRYPQRNPPVEGNSVQPDGNRASSDGQDQAATQKTGNGPRPDVPANNSRTPSVKVVRVGRGESRTLAPESAKQANTGSPGGSGTSTELEAAEVRQKATERDRNTEQSKQASETEQRREEQRKQTSETEQRREEQRKQTSETEQRREEQRRQTSETEQRREEQRKQTSETERRREEQRKQTSETEQRREEQRKQTSETEQRREEQRKQTSETEQRREEQRKQTSETEQRREEQRKQTSETEQRREEQRKQTSETERRREEQRKQTSETEQRREEQRKQTSETEQRREEQRKQTSETEQRREEQRKQTSETEQRREEQRKQTSETEQRREEQRKQTSETERRREEQRKQTSETEQRREEQRKQTSETEQRREEQRKQTSETEQRREEQRKQTSETERRREEQRKQTSETEQRREEQRKQTSETEQRREEQRKQTSETEQRREEQRKQTSETEQRREEQRKQASETEQRREEQRKQRDAAQQRYAEAQRAKREESAKKEAESKRAARLKEEEQKRLERKKRYEKAQREKREQAQRQRQKKR